MEHNGKPVNKKKGSTPDQTTEEIYHAWLKRPQKKSPPAGSEDAHVQKPADPPSGAD